ncbi:MAG: AI-2E family transporter, partial [Dactylosporangium sp.]|nr:AI-2E family transporter [Dactylosporangium sp.]
MGRLPSVVGVALAGTAVTSERYRAALPGLRDSPHYGGKAEVCREEVCVGRFDRLRASIRRVNEARRARMQRALAKASAEEPLPITVTVVGEPGIPVAPTNPPVPAQIHSSTVSRDDADVPRGLRIAAAWAWRLLVLGVVGYFLLHVVALLKHVIVPLAIALLLSALLTPAVITLRRLNVPRSLATALVLVGGLAAVVGTLTLVVNQFVAGVPDLADNARQGIAQIQRWLETGPLHLSDNQLETAVDTATNWVKQNRGTLTTGALSTASGVFDVLAGLFLVLFATFFFLRDGERIWRAVVSVLPRAARAPVAAAGEASWLTLVAYVRATVLVAFIDAVGIGIACAVLDVPFAFSLAALVFLASFVPIVGATLSGAVAVLVALVAKGPVIALILLAAVIAVQQLEGHVLQPLIMGRAVAIHPL